MNYTHKELFRPKSVLSGDMVTFPFPLICKNCGIWFCSLGDIKCHLLTCPTAQVSLECGHCAHVWSDWLGFYRHIHQSGMTRRAPYNVNYSWARTESVKGVTSMDTYEPHLSQIRIVADPQDMVHAAMSSAGLPTTYERQDGTPSDVEPTTPPGSELTSNFRAPKSSLQGVRPSCWPDSVCMYPISDPHDAQLPVTLGLLETLGIDTSFYRETARETELEVIEIRDTPPTLEKFDGTELLETDLTPVETNRMTDDCTQTEKNWTETTSVVTDSTTSSAKQPSGVDFVEIPNSLWHYANEQLKMSNLKLHSLLRCNYFIASLLNGRVGEDRLLTEGELNFMKHEVHKGIWPREFLGITSAKILTLKLRDWYAQVHAAAPEQLETYSRLH